MNSPRSIGTEEENFSWLKRRLTYSALEIKDMNSIVLYFLMFF